MNDDELLKEFGLKLKFYRIKCNMTQAQLGDITNMSEHRISQIENGKCNLTIKKINLITNALGYPFYKFFYFDD